MSNDDIEIIGKKVKDMYGAPIGTVIGTITDIDGSIQTVGVDCGSQGLQQFAYEQLVVQGETVIFIPKWRLDSQRLLREKGLTLRRLKALIDIVSENDDMKEDAEIIHEKYKSKLISLDETEEQIKAKLATRLAELDTQMRSIKTISFDSKVQYKSNEISESTFELVKKYTTDLIEHITHESAEISNVQRRISDLNVEVHHALEIPGKKLQESAVTYLDTSAQDVETKLPEAPTQEPVAQSPVFQREGNNESVAPQQVSATTQESNQEKPDWLARMEAQ